MKKKLLLIITLSAIITFLIYNHFDNTKIDLLILGDGVASGMTGYNVEGYSFNDYIRDYLQEENYLNSYVRSFVSKGQRTEDLLYLLENNNTIEFEGKTLTILQAIANSNLITISIGTDEIAMNASIHKTSELQNTIQKNMKNILQKIRSFSNKPIILIGLYYSDEYDNRLIDQINNYYQQISLDYNCIYVDTTNIITDNAYLSRNNSHYLNYKGHELISQKVISNITF